MIEPIEIPPIARLEGITDCDFLSLLLILELNGGMLTLPSYHDPERNEQRIALAVCEANPGMTPEYWKNLDPPSREPWLEKTLDVLMNEKKDQSSRGSKEAASESGWFRQADVAKRLGYSKMKITRMVRRGELRTNGKTGHACRVDPLSILEYCEREGVTWNES
jgi:hypothetical protein